MELCPGEGLDSWGRSRTWKGAKEKPTQVRLRKYCGWPEIPPLPLFPKAGNRMKRARARHKPCALKELEVTVSELGLGYESDETVLFRYCSGTCETAVRNYDMSLKNMRLKKKIKKEKVRARPCCRPLSYDDDVSFLDARNHYHTVNELSAKECGCV
uniref:Neurturin n=1 Tax=Sphenodon punctatus TaxID=8508 RepID=A0A8D0H4H9_SPHPU